MDLILLKLVNHLDTKTLTNHFLTNELNNSILLILIKQFININ
jgi:hypothetical protein